EAIDCSVKLCRQYHIENGQPQRIHYIGRKRSYHGNSITTLALSHHRARRAPYEPLFPSIFHHVSPAYAYRYQHDNESTSKYVARLAAELEGKIQELGTDKVAAFYAETGESRATILSPVSVVTPSFAVVGATTGCVTAPEGYFAAMQDVCKRYGVLLVLDEIMCGSTQLRSSTCFSANAAELLVGRTGKMYAYEWEGIVPDVVIVGKALASGYIPLSAVLLSSSVVATFRQGSGAFNNGHTFQSHVLACRAALKVQEIIRHDNLVEHCKSQGAILERLLRDRFSSHPYVGDIRGRGLFWGMEFVLSKQDKTCFPVEIPLADLIEAACRASGLAVYPGGKGTFDGVVGDHILIAPPYTVETHEIEEIVDKLEAALKAVFDGLKLT
ncbi:hypothetical protein EMMF5_006571, partial [Cystobasidiomycetes sp. EMM_F5]